MAKPPQHLFTLALSIVAVVAIVAILSFTRGPSTATSQNLAGVADLAVGPTTEYKCHVADTLLVGETRTYTAVTREYEITSVWSDGARAKFSVNGELTDALVIGGSDNLSNSIITLTDIGKAKRTYATSFCLVEISNPPPQPPPDAVCDIEDTLRSGETRTYLIDGVEYEVTNLASAVQTNAKGLGGLFSVNGVRIFLQENGPFDTTYGSLAIGLRETIPYSSRVCMFGSQIQVQDTLQEGETRTYTLNRREYEVTNVFVSDTVPVESKLSINGQLSVALREGSTYRLDDGTRVSALAVYAPADTTSRTIGYITFRIG